MKSMRLSDSGETLLEVDVPRPAPKAGEVLVRVHAAGITPSELGWYPTTHTKDGQRRSGAVPCHEFSGEIFEIGKGVEELSIGQPVYGMNDWFEDGALAEYCITRPEWIVEKPRSLSHIKAAAVPIGALTAWQGLFEHAKLRTGERVLVQGGAGAVGTFAVQLAHLHGAHVVTTVAARNIDFIKQLGADEAIDYQANGFEEKVREVDVVFDAVGGVTLSRSWGVLKGNGRLVTIAADSGASLEERVKRAFFIVEPRRDQMGEIEKKLDTGDLQVVVDTVTRLSQAGALYKPGVARSGRGKMVVCVLEAD